MHLSADVQLVIGQVLVTVLVGFFVVAFIHTHLSLKVKADALVDSRDLVLDDLLLQRPPAEDPRVALERSAFAPIEDAVREGEERAVREWARNCDSYALFRFR